MSHQNDSAEEIEQRRKRLVYRAAHRGIREMDLILGPFAARFAFTMSEAEIERLENLMEEQDADLLIWITGQAKAPETVDRDLLGKIIDFQKRRSGHGA